jgi:predicted DNA-binding transcriptional regulator AlpA
VNDLSNIASQFAAIVSEQLDARENATAAREAEARLITAILSKPLLALPQDLQTVAGCAVSTAYDIMKRPAFPKTFVLGRQRFVRIDEFMEALPRIGGA